MTRQRNWHRCIALEDHDVEEFIMSHFTSPARVCLLVGGAGFDPRSAEIAQRLSEALDGANADRLRALFVRERRPKPDPDLVLRGDRHAARLQALVKNAQVADIEVLSNEDRAVVCGHRAVELLRVLGTELLNGVTDIVLDLSALSIGVSFPLASYLLEMCERHGDGINFHLMVASHSQLDAAISSVSNDAVDPIRGFSGGIELAESAEHAKIWLPHLSTNRNAQLNRIREKLSGPVDICPVLPISEQDPKAADRLIAEFQSELNQEWEVDPRNLIYALENDPLDLYRTISAIHRRRKSIFNRVPGMDSHLVLSPSGNKVLAIGALMAALEHDLPVRYVEAVSYAVDWKQIESLSQDQPHLVHVWLHGEPYAKLEEKIVDDAVAPKETESLEAPS